MNAIFFGLKRAFHGSLRVYRRALASLGLTAARFDLLYALIRSGSQGALQNDVRRALGVSAPTVSRMLGSLEDLGWVRRRRSRADRRMRYVFLTSEGRRRIREAIEIFIRAGHVQLAVDSALCPDRWDDRAACLDAMDACESTLGRLRGAYRDFATLRYRWHPADGGR